mgnify:CR=1 FL=1
MKPLLSRLGIHAAILGCYVLLASALTYPVAFHLTTHIPIVHQIPGWAPGDGDPWHSLWGLWFAKYSLFERGRLPLFTDDIFYPRGVDLGYATWVMVPLLLSLPLVSLIGLVATYNVLILASLALAGYSAFLLVHHLTKDRKAAFVSGLIFAFSPYHMVRSLEHLFLLASAVWVPLYVLFLIKALQEGGFTNIGLASAFLIFTMASNPYYAVFLLLFTGLYLLDQIRRPDVQVPKRALFNRLSSLFVLSSALSLPIVGPALMREWTDITLSTPLSEVNIYSADLLAFFIPGSAHPLWGKLVKPIYKNFTGNVFEQTVYIGYIVLALSSMAFFKARREEVRFWSLSAMIFFVLSLGPVLHINGRYAFDLDGMTLTFPLPSLLLHFIPVLKGIRVFSRFSFMLMLSLAVLVGYGLKVIRERLQGTRWGPRIETAFLLLVSVGILFEFLSVPLPILDAKIPHVYTVIGRDGGRGGSLLELPLDWKIAKYQYYQTAHRKRLIMGFVPRPSPSLVEYADAVPFIKLFKDPDRLEDLQGSLWEKKDALKVVDLFDLDFIVVHREYLEPRIADGLQRLLVETFPVDRIDKEGSLVVLHVRRDHDSTALWGNPIGYRLDFGPSGSPFVTKGWSQGESWGDVTMAWADARESTLWFYLPKASDIKMELKLLPFNYPSAPEQRVKVFVNGRYLDEIQLDRSGWQVYSLKLPGSSLSSGINTIRFIYRYAASPSKVVPGSRDPRTLAVAFDDIVLRPE